MHELNADNAIAYLREKGWIGAEPAQAELLSGGVSNQVLRISTPSRRFVLKQSRPQLRTRDAWFSDLDRIYREQAVMQALHPYLPTVVPEVLYVDQSNYVFAMSHAPLEAKVWKAELLDGNIDLALGKKVGEVLGRMHRVAAEDANRFHVFKGRNVFVQLRVDPFYRRVQERWPEVASVVTSVIHNMLTINESLCHGDYTPKNILVHAGEFTLVDYETAHFGDPTMDLGLFMAHLTLKAVRIPEEAEKFYSLMDAFWQGYCEAAGDERALHEYSGIRHCGICLLARVDGTSPVDYLPESSKREIVRRLGCALLLDEEIGQWQEVWQRCDTELRK